jgi:hypothetical protein
MADTQQQTESHLIDPPAMYDAGQVAGHHRIMVPDVELTRLNQDKTRIHRLVRAIIPPGQAHIKAAIEDHWMAKFDIDINDNGAAFCAEEP